MQKIFSHSSLSAFDNCPKKYHFRYIAKIPAEFESIEGFVGKQVHTILERLFQFTDSGRVPSLEKVINRYHQNWDAAFDSTRIRIFRSEFDERFYRNAGSRCLSNFYRRYYPFDRGKTLGLERGVRLSLDPSGQYKVRGFIDRLVRAPDGALEIHDYKTSARMPRAGILKEDRQLALYELAIRDELDEKGEIRLVWLYLQPDRIHVERRTPDELKQLREFTIAAIDRVRSETKWRPRKNPLCNWCEYQSICPAWNDMNGTDSSEAQEQLSGISH